MEGARLVEEDLGKKRAPWTKTMAHEGEDHTKEKMEYIQIIIPLFEEMNQNIVVMSQQITKGFELMANQMGSKGITRDSGSSKSA